MAFLGDNVFDQGLNYLRTNGDVLVICSAEPASYAEVGTYGLGTKTGLSIGAPGNRAGGGREVTVPQITDGDVTVQGTATHWAITDGSGELLATGDLTAVQIVYAGNVFTLPSFKIGIPDPV